MPKGVKFRGKSVYQVLTKLNDVSATRSGLWQMQQAAQERINRLHREAAEYLIGLGLEEFKDMEWDQIHFGNHWKCEKSPTDYCVYHNVEDHWHDHCLFCEEPEERK